MNRQEMIAYEIGHLDSIHDKLMALDTADKNVMAWDYGLAVKFTGPNQPQACGIASGAATIYTDAEAAAMRRRGYREVLNGHGEAAKLMPLADAVARVAAKNREVRAMLAEAA